MSTINHSIRRVVFVVGEDPAEVRQVRLRLGMYPAVAVTEATPLTALAEELEVSAPDCAVGLIPDRRWGGRFQKALLPRQPLSIIFAMQKPKPALVAFARNAKAPFTYGRRGLSIRTAAMVAETLMLAPHVIPKVDVDHVGLRHANGDTTAVSIVDASAQALLLSAPQEMKTRSDQQGTLLVHAKGHEPIALDGSFECWGPELQEDLAVGLFRLVTIGPEAAAGYAKLLWGWTETTLASSRKNGAELSNVRTSRRVKPSIKFTVRLNPEGTKRQYYFRINDIGRSGAMLHADAGFATGLTPGDQVGLRIQSVRGQVSLGARVVRIQEPGTDASAPNCQAVAIDFLKDSEAEAELGRLLCLAEVE